MSDRDPFKYEFLILTDADGFTTCCRLSDDMREMGRRPMRTPITVFHWKRVNDRGPHGGWKLMSSYQWVPL